MAIGGNIEMVEIWEGANLDTILPFSQPEAAEKKYRAEGSHTHSHHSYIVQDPRRTQWMQLL